MWKIKLLVRIYCYPILAGFFNAIGIGWEKLGTKLGQETLISQIKFLHVENVGRAQVGERLNIILLAYLGVFTTNNIIQIIIGKILQARGHNVKVILADRILPICETTDINTHHKRKEICNYNIRYAKKLFEHAGFEILWLSELVSDNEVEALMSKIDDSDYDVYVQSMLLRYTKSGSLDLDNPFTKSLFIKARHAALISEALGKAIVKLKPDRVAFAHGTYTSRGPAKDIINNAGIPAFSISRAKMAETQKLNWKTSGDWWDVSEEWNHVKNTPLTTNQELMINNYLNSRRSHSRDIIAYNLSAERSKQQTLTDLNLDGGRKIFTLFTNVLWDAASAQRELVYENSIEWIFETIKLFIAKEDYLIVRIHPAESIIGTNQPIEDLIKNEFPELPDNIRILPPQAELNSWSILKITDIGIVHTSTVGLELALEGIPCICVAKTHYRGRGFTIDVDSVEDYQLAINGYCGEYELDQIQALALRYSFLIFLRYQLPLPYLNPKSHIATKSLKTTEIDFNLNPSLKTIIDGIENQNSFLLPVEVTESLYAED